MNADPSSPVKPDEVEARALERWLLADSSTTTLPMPEAVRELVLGRVRPLDMLVIGQLFWPSFREYRGLVLLDPAWMPVPEDYEFERWVDTVLAKREGVVWAAERDLNWLDLTYLYTRGPEAGAIDLALGALQRALKQAWVGRLAMQYPGRQFVVHLLNEQETGDGPGLVFHSRPLAENL